jgi:hypothetical protein
MNLVEKIQSIFITIATLGPCGNWPFGAIIGSTLAWPVILMIRTTSYIHQDLYFWTITTLIILSLAILQCAYSSLAPYEQHRIILSSAMGFVIGYAYMPFAFGWMALGFCIYHVTRLGIGIWAYNRWNLEFHRLPGILSLVTRDLIAGMVSFGLMHTIKFFIQ